MIASTASGGTSSRLNPKLIQRRPMPPPPDATNTIIFEQEEEMSESESSTDDSDLSEDGKNRKHAKKELKEKKRIEEEKRQKKEEEKKRFNLLPGSSNPNTHLIHNGKWIKKEYKLGRAIPFTGIWSCCGNTTALSIYCQSIFAREDMVEALRKISMEKAAEIAYRALKYENVKMPWNRNELGAPREFEFTAEDAAMEYAGSLESSFNAPMLMSWMYKNYKEEPTTLTGMGFLLHHLEKAEGCALMFKHGAVGALNRIHMHYREHPPLQLQCITALGRMLECNFTRDDIISNTDALRIAFNVAHLHMNSRAHVDTAVRCIAQCARSEVCRVEIMKKRIYAYMLNFCKRFSSTASILRSCLKLFNWVSTTAGRLIEICNAGVVKMILILMAKHISDADVIAPAMLFLTRASEIHPPALQTILKKKAVSLIIRALQALYSNEILQLAGLKMIQTLSKTQEGWKQISDTKGGWQSICQGTVLGDSLVHDLPGALHNPGWAIGDTPHLQVTDRIKILNAKSMQIRAGAVPKAAWTAHALRDYMGIAMKQTKLAVNNEQHETYFELLSTLELLPEPGEQREYWFIRVKEYEAENEIKLEEMAATMLELKHKEALDKKKAEQLLKKGLVEEDGNNGKLVFVNGIRVTTDLLATSELTLDEMMNRTNIDYDEKK